MDWTRCVLSLGWADGEAGVHTALLSEGLSCGRISEQPWRGGGQEGFSEDMGAGHLGMGAVEECSAELCRESVWPVCSVRHRMVTLVITPPSSHLLSLSHHLFPSLVGGVHMGPSGNRTCIEVVSESRDFICLLASPVL